jgi:DNA-binding HxlR family transcriptional regulator
VQAKKSLTSTLRGLERDGLVRSIPAKVPIRVDYEAPALGHELIAKIPTFLELVWERYSQLPDGRASRQERAACR